MHLPLDRSLMFRAFLSRWIIAPYCVVPGPNGGALAPKPGRSDKKKKESPSLAASFAALKSSPKVGSGKIQIQIQIQVQGIILTHVPILISSYFYRQVASLAILVMSYGVAHRLFEFAWKGQV
jgi:hypothetical protein